MKLLRPVVPLGSITAIRHVAWDQQYFNLRWEAVSYPCSTFDRHVGLYKWSGLQAVVAAFTQKHCLCGECVLALCTMATVREFLNTVCFCLGARWGLAVARVWPGRREQG